MSETPGIYNAEKAASDTPRTDENTFPAWEFTSDTPVVKLDFVQRLERENTTLLRDNEELNARLAERTQDHLKASERDVAEIQRLRVENDALKRRLADLEAEHAWRPIEEAPKDGTKFLGVSEDGYMAVWFSDCDWEDWRSNDDLAFDSPTHFRPLPKPPQSTP